MTVINLPKSTLVIALIAIAAGLQSSIGFGFNILAVPILALFDPDLTPIPTMVMGIPLIAMVFLRERNHVDFKSLRWIIAGRVPDAFLGAALLATVSRRFLDGYLAVIVLELSSSSAPVTRSLRRERPSSPSDWRAA